MDYEFWDNCWSRPSQPFHVAKPHPLLEKYLHLFKAKEKILLPLSGKSIDPIFLAQNDFPSSSIEFNPKAIESFITENKLEPKIVSEEKYKHYQFSDFDIWQADFFELTAEKLGLFSQVFDRAALVALPEDLRENYTKHLQSLLKPKANILMVLMDYATDEMSGPPFLITASELQTYFPEAKITELDRQSLLGNHERWEELELSLLDEVLYQIQF